MYDFIVCTVIFVFYFLFEYFVTIGILEKRFGKK